MGKIIKLSSLLVSMTLLQACIITEPVSKTAQGTLLYAACIRNGGVLNLGAESVSLYQVETKSGQEFVKTGLMTDENFEQGDSELDFDPNWFEWLLNLYC